ncbi:MAG: hypothetical protein M3Y69_03780 [Verrucomicrobiota bacterium]|nr:hypothetical protein [Verrucomicrobiota bacterium]
MKESTAVATDRPVMEARDRFTAVLVDRLERATAEGFYDTATTSFDGDVSGPDLPSSGRGFPAR